MPRSDCREPARLETETIKADSGAALVLVQGGITWRFRRLAERDRREREGQVACNRGLASLDDLACG